MSTCHAIRCHVLIGTRPMLRTIHQHSEQDQQQYYESSHSFLRNLQKLLQVRHLIVCHCYRYVFFRWNNALRLLRFLFHCHSQSGKELLGKDF